MGSVAIVMTVIAQVNLQYLTHFLEQGQGFVDRSMTYSGKSGFDFFVELGCTRMSFAHSNQTHQFQALWRQPVIALFQRKKKFVKSGLWVRHSKTLIIIGLYR